MVLFSGKIRKKWNKRLGLATNPPAPCLFLNTSIHYSLYVHHILLLQTYQLSNPPLNSNSLIFAKMLSPLLHPIQLHQAISSATLIDVQEAGEKHVAPSLLLHHGQSKSINEHSYKASMAGGDGVVVGLEEHGCAFTLVHTSLCHKKQEKFMAHIT